MSLSSTNEAASAVHVSFLQHYFQLAALVFTFYDHVITLDQEVELIWARETLVKIQDSLSSLPVHWGYSCILRHIYLLEPKAIGCVKPVDVDLMNSCLMGMRMTMLIAMVSTWITQLILQSRIQALYNSNYVSWFLYVLFSGEVFGLSILVVRSIRGIEVTSQPFFGTHQCTLTKIPSWVFMFWISVLLFDMILTFLMLRLVYIWWSRQSGETVSQQCFGVSLVSILLRDNFGHCISAFAVYIVTVIVWLTAEARYASIPSCFSYSVTTVMGTRLILNLCDAYHNPSSHPSGGTSEWDAMSCFTAVDFAPTSINGGYNAGVTLRVPLDVESNVREDVPAVGLKTTQPENT